MQPGLIINDNNKLTFITELLQVEGANPFKTTVSGMELSCAQPVMMEMLRRFNEGQTVVFPLPSTTGIQTLVLNSDLQTVLKHTAEIKSFLVPVWAEVYPLGISYFDPAEGVAERLGAELFPKGYCSFRSPKNVLPDLLRLLGLWTQLDQQRPEIAVEEIEASAWMLRRRFHQALSLQNWPEAEHVLSLLQEGRHLRENHFLFLKVELLSARGQWSTIWSRPDLMDLVRVEPLPSAVRGALITAFYKTLIARVEESGDHEKTLAVFRQQRARLGPLLNYRSGLSGDLFLRVFAYEAVLNGQRVKLAQLLDEVQMDREDEHQETIALLQALSASLGAGNAPQRAGEGVDTIPPSEPPREPVVSFERYDKLSAAQQAFQSGNYDDAYLYASDSPDSVLRTRLLLGLAAMTEDPGITREATEAFHNGPAEEREEVIRDPAAKAWAKLVMGSIGTTPQWDEGPTRPLPADWLAWFKAVLEGEIGRAELSTSLDQIMEHPERTGQDAGTLLELAESLLAIATETINPGSKALLKTALPAFAEFVLNDPIFPNPSGEDLYDCLLLALQTQANKNAFNAGFLLKLVEGLLQLDLEQVQKQWPGLEQWFFLPPSQKFAPYVLDLLSLFSEYGFSSEPLGEMWGNWMGILLPQFSPDLRTQAEVWLQLGRLLNGDFTLLQGLESVLELTPPLDLIGALPAGKITIFSCREKAASRAAEKIAARNPDLSVRVCTDDRLTTEAKTYAAHSDINIVVTACISHALTYGIAPYLRQPPIYPRSSGEAGIIEALEDYARGRS